MRQFLTGTSRCRHVRTGGELLFNDLLGSTLGTLGGDGYRPVSLTAFGDTEDAGAFFTGKPLVDGLGYAFLLRSYRPDHGKWLTADPLGYPDGWNRLAYCHNAVVEYADSRGGWTIQVGITFSAAMLVGGTFTIGIAIGYSEEAGYTAGWYDTYGGGIDLGVGGCYWRRGQYFGRRSN